MGRIRTLTAIGSMGFLLALTGCGGGGGDTPAPAPATGFAYTDPTAGAGGWRFVRNAASTSTHLVLDLVPPAGASGRGVGFTLQAEGKVTWAKVAGGDAELVKPAAVYDLGAAPQAVLALEKGATLTVGVYQKGPGNEKTYAAGTPLLSVAMDFKATAGLKAGDSIPLRVEKISHLPASGTPADIKAAVAVGTLKAQ